VIGIFCPLGVCGLLRVCVFVVVCVLIGGRPCVCGVVSVYVRVACLCGCSFLLLMCGPVCCFGLW